MGQKISGTVIATADVMNVDIGFIPDEVWLWTALGGTELSYHWLRVLADKAGTGQYGVLDSAGAKSTPTTAATGIIPYNGAETPRVRIVSPDGDGFTQALVYGDWSAAVDYNSVGTDRSVTAIGTIVRPPTHNGKVFELTTGTGSGTSEPTTWDVAPGESVTDGGSNIWICREEDIVRAAGLGFTIGATICSDGEILAFTAEKHLKYRDLGDADSTDPVTLVV